MAPPRIQCLNAARGVLRKGVERRAFSSSAIRRADGTSSSETSDLLSSLDDSLSQSRPPSSYTTPSTPNLNQSIRLGRQVSTTNSGILNLLKTSRQPSPTAPSTSPSKFDLPTEFAGATHGQDLTKQIHRRWKTGDVYAPHDLSASEMGKWRNKKRPDRDVFDVLGFEPLSAYSNFSIMSEYMTPMGRIRHSNETGLRPKNQRRIAKAIRRSIGMGMMPSVHRHPEILQKNAARNEQRGLGLRGAADRPY